MRDAALHRTEVKLTSHCAGSYNEGTTRPLPFCFHFTSPSLKNINKKPARSVLPRNIPGTRNPYPAPNALASEHDVN